MCTFSYQKEPIAESQIWLFSNLTCIEPILRFENIVVFTDLDISRMAVDVDFLQEILKNLKFYQPFILVKKLKCTCIDNKLIIALSYCSLFSM